MAVLLAVFCTACDSESNSDPTPQSFTPDWNLAVDSISPGVSLNEALLGFYDLSGSLLD